MLKRKFYVKRQRLIPRKRICRFCLDNVMIDYKDVDRLSHYITDRGRIIPRRISGNCAKHQRELTRAIKRARVMGIGTKRPAIEPNIGMLKKHKASTKYITA